MATVTSEHASVREQYDKIHGAGVTNVIDRFEEQGRRCTFCEQGVSCQLCSQGPCRIKGSVTRGVCGIDANGMVMRNLVQKDNMGIAAYTFHARSVAKTLIATGEGKTPFSIKDQTKLDLLAQAYGVAAEPVAVGEAILASLNEDTDTESSSVLAFATESRKQLWRELGILPGGPVHEIVDATARSMTNIDGDYVSLAKTALRLGIASAFGSLVPLELAQDALFGTPSPHPIQVDLGIIDPEYVNILPNGHEPFVGFALIQAARTEKAQKLAKAAGAKGLRIVGSIETGEELAQRTETDNVFVGVTGNWINTEYAIATGGVDVFAMDMNCSVPSLKEVADKYGTTLVAVSKLIGVPGVEKRLDYQPGKVGEQAWQLIEWAVENFKARKGRARSSGLPQREVIAGFSTEAVLGALGGTLAPLLDVIKQGAIKGVAALVSCTTLTNGPQDSLTVALTKELISRDLLVLSAGCGNAACQVAGLTGLEAQKLAGAGLKGVCEQLGIPPVLSFGTCTDCGRLALLVGAVADALGVDTAQVPIVVTAPEYMEQKATIDAFSAVALGLYTHVSPTPPVTGAPGVVKLLTEDVEGLVGGKVAVGDEAGPVADGIEEHINKKRAGLGL